MSEEKRCFSCGHLLNLKALNSSKQRQAAHVCASCVEASMTREELLARLNPRLAELEENVKGFAAERGFQWEGLDGD